MKKNWRHNNAERSRARNRERSKRWRDAHPGEQVKRSLACRAKKPDEYKAAQRDYRQRTPAQCRARWAKYQADKLRATPVWADDELNQLIVAEAYDLAQLRGTATGIVHHVDHVVPLRSPKVCESTRRSKSVRDCRPRQHEQSQSLLARHATRRVTLMTSIDTGPLAGPFYWVN